MGSVLSLGESMNIDYYAFMVDEYGQTDYAKRREKNKAHIYENLEFDMATAKSIDKCAIFCKEMGKFYDGNWNELNIAGKRVLPRCIIPETGEIYDALEKEGAVLAVTREDIEKIVNWPRYIKPAYRSVVRTTYREFLKDFECYKEKLGRVFFKTKNKNISCEVLAVACLNDFCLVEIESDSDLIDGNKEVGDSTFFNEPVYMVFTNQSTHGNDHRFNYLDKNAEVFVQGYVEVCKDEQYPHIPVEYRSFVVDGQFVTSRSWVPNRAVPEEVLDITKKIIEAMPKDMNKTFVVDVLAFIDDNGELHYDLCELNPISSSGYEEGSSIFIAEPSFNNQLVYPKYDGIVEESEA